MSRNELLETLRMVIEETGGPSPWGHRVGEAIAWLEDEANKVDVSEGRYAGVEAWLLK